MGGQEGPLGDLGSQPAANAKVATSRPIGERESTSSDLSRLIIGNTLTLGTGACPSFVCGRRSGFLRRQQNVSIWFRICKLYPVGLPGSLLELTTLTFIPPYEISYFRDKDMNEVNLKPE